MFELFTTFEQMKCNYIKGKTIEIERLRALKHFYSRCSCCRYSFFYCSLEKCVRQKSILWAMNFDSEVLRKGHHINATFSIHFFFSFIHWDKLYVCCFILKAKKKKLASTVFILPLMLYCCDSESINGWIRRKKYSHDHVHVHKMILANNGSKHGNLSTKLI